MADQLKGKRVAILVADGFEQSELKEPKKALEAAGAIVEIVSPIACARKGTVRGWKRGDWGKDVGVDVVLEAANTNVYDALVLPGGVLNPDTLRTISKAVEFVQDFVTAKKPIAAICHGPWTLINAGAVRGRKVTSWPSLRADLTNAGAQWVDEEVVVDQGLVTSRKPDDLPVFCARMIEEFAEGRHEKARAPQPQAAG